MVVIVEALDRRLLYGAVHARPGRWMLRLCQPVFDIVGLAGAIERMTAPHGCRLRAVFRQIDKLDAVVGQNDLDLVGNGGHQSSKESPCRQDAAVRESVIITKNGRPRTVLIAYEDYICLAKRDRRVEATTLLSDADINAVEQSNLEPGLD